MVEEEEEEGAAAEPEPGPGPGIELRPYVPAPVSYELFSNAPVMGFGNTGRAQHVAPTAPIASSAPPPTTAQAPYPHQPRPAPTYHGDDAAAALASAGMMRFAS